MSIVKSQLLFIIPGKYEKKLEVGSWKLEVVFNF